MIFSRRHSSEKRKERKQEGEGQRGEKDTVDNFAKREAKRRAISTFTRCVTKKTENAEETLIRAHSITRIKTPCLAFRVFPTANPSFRPIFSLSFFLLFSSALPSALFSSRPRYRQFLSRTEGTVLASIIPTSILPWLRWKNLALGLSRQRTQRRRIPRVFFRSLPSRSAPPFPVSVLFFHSLTLFFCTLRHMLSLSLSLLFFLSKARTVSENSHSLDEQRKMRKKSCFLR